MELRDLFGVNDEPWMENGRCHTDTDFNGTGMTYLEWQKINRETDFFSEHGAYRKYAKQYCLGCPVRLDCLIYANQYPELDGVYGGLSSRDRKKIRRDAERAVENLLSQMREQSQDGTGPTAA